jgi:hypothetical protein
MLKPGAIGVLLLLFTALVTGLPAGAQVDFVMGTITSPPNLKKGDSVRPGTEIQTGADGLVMLSQEWLSDVKSRKCVSVTVFGYGKSYTVSDDATPGQCETVAIAVPAAGRPILSRGTRYAAAKFDDTPPEKVLKSDGEWVPFDNWARAQQESARAQEESALPQPPSPPATGQSPDHPAPRMGSLVNGLVYLQADYRSVPVNSAAACSALCLQETQCAAMTFIISQQLCWLKDSVPATASSPDMISAVKIR